MAESDTHLNSTALALTSLYQHVELIKPRPNILKLSWFNVQIGSDIFSALGLTLNTKTAGSQKHVQ